MQFIVNTKTRRFANLDNLTAPLSKSAHPLLVSKKSVIVDINLVDGDGKPFPIDPNAFITLFGDNTADSSDQAMFICESEVGNAVSITDAANGKIRFTINTNTVAFIAKCGSEAKVKLEIDGFVMLVDYVNTKPNHTSDAGAPTEDNLLYKNWQDTKLYIDAAIDELSAGITVSSKWEDITGKPTAFPPESHTHDIYSLNTHRHDDVYSVVSHSHTATDIGAEAAGTTASHNASDSAHANLFSAKADLENGKVPSSQLPNLLSLGETAATAFPGDRGVTLENKVTALENATPGTGEGASTWDQISGKPTTFPPSSHTHSWDSDINGKPTIPTKLSQLQNDAGFVTVSGMTQEQVDARINALAAPANHMHNAYSLTTHNHDGVYSAVGHNHAAADVGAEAAGAVANHNVAADAHNARFSSKADLVDGKVPAAQLPSYVDDVIESAALTSFPESGETGKIYVALDTNKTYRWGGTEYIEISASLALGETAATAFPGDRGKAIETALPNKVDKVAGKGLSSNDYTTDEKNKLAGLSNYDDTELAGRVTALETSGGSSGGTDFATVAAIAMNI